MTRKNYPVTIILYSLFTLVTFLSSCGKNGGTEKNLQGNSGDTLREYINESSFRNIDEQLFSLVKNNDYHKVYVLQESFIDDYGHSFWQDYWIIDDLSKEEYNEMKKYADWVYYYDKVMKNDKWNHGVYKIQRFKSDEEKKESSKTSEEIIREFAEKNK